MRIILNSDVLHTKRRWADGLPRHIEKLCRCVVAARAIIVLPRTVVFEDERHQTLLDEEEAVAVERAISRLRGWKVSIPEIDVRKVMPKRDVVEALRLTGAIVEVEEPNLDDYREAEKRASLHSSPHPPDIASDEMRDLTIWQVATRIATRDGGAVLVSRDQVHAHERGANEAQVAKLSRAKTFDETLAILAAGGSPEVREALARIEVEFAEAVSVRAKPKDRSGGRESGAVPASAFDLDTKVLGFIAFFAGATKDELFGMLSGSGVARQDGEEVARKLVAAQTIDDTGHHYLVRDKAKGAAASALVEPEIIKLLGLD